MPSRGAAPIIFILCGCGLRHDSFLEARWIVQERIFPLETRSRLPSYDMTNYNTVRGQCSS